MSVSTEIIDSNIFAHTVAEEIRFLIEDAVNARGHCVISLAGGKTPASIYRKLSLPPFVGAIPWEKVSILWGDERWVSKEDSQSNYHMTKETLLDRLNKSKPEVYPVNTTLNTPAAGAKEYEETIRKVTKVADGVIPSIDIVLLGLGEDGHTASLFPNSPALKSNKTLCESVVTDEITKDRITITFPLITEAKRVIFIVSGNKKADIVREILETDVDELTYPAAIYKKAKGKVGWFIESAAGANLAR